MIAPARRLLARWCVVCWAMALPAACDGGDATPGHGGAGHSAAAGDSDAWEGEGASGGVRSDGVESGGAASGSASAGFAGGGGEGREVAGGSGESGLLAAGAGGNRGAAGEEGGAGAPNPSIQLKDFGDYQVVQRKLGARQQQVRIWGTFTGSSITSVQAQVVAFEERTTVIAPWAELGRTSEGEYSGTLDVPQGGWYRTLVRGLDAQGSEVSRVAGDHRWGVGMNILCIGQSNMVGHGGRSYTIVDELAGLYGNDGTWKHLADPYDRGGSPSEADFDSGSGASLVPSLVNALHDYLPGLPIGVIPAAKGSSPLACANSDWCWSRRNADDPADPSTLYGHSLADALAAGGVELIVMHQGETDATNGTSRATYASELALLAQNYRTDLGDVPLFMCQLGRSTTEISAKNRSDASMQAIRAAQRDSDDPPRVYLAATAIDLDVDATDHYVKTTLDELGRRIAGSIAYHYQAAGSPRAYRGPEIASVSYADASRTVIDVHLNHRAGSDFTPAAGINGFAVLDGATPVRLASVMRWNQTTIRITLKSAIAGAGSVRYLYGKLPFQTLANTVHDDSSLALPLEPTTSDLLLAP